MGTHISAAPESRAVLDALRWIFQGIRESSRRAEREVGLSGAQLFVLRAVAESPRLSLNDLAARTRTHQSTVSVVVSDLLRRGLVRRVRTPEDARRVAITLTPAGGWTVARTPDLVQDRLIRAIEELPPARRRALARGLAEVARTVADPERHPPMFLQAAPPRRRAARA